MPVIITPNMGLIEPVVGQEPGPTWASDLNASLQIIDQHNHSAGQGVQINPDGININTDLPFNGNNATELNTVRFDNLSGTLAGTAPNLGCIYEAVNELYYNDGVGNVVQLTKAGSVNATSSGIVNGTASASFVGGTLVVDANVNTPANVQGASFLFGNNVVGSNYLTLEPPNAMASNYTVTLPPINTSGGTVFMTYDTSNDMGLGPAVTGGITTSNIANQSITQTLLAPRALGNPASAGGITQVGPINGSFSSLTPISVISGMTITTTGRPVQIFFSGPTAGTFTNSSLYFSNVNTDGFNGYIYFQNTVTGQYTGFLVGGNALAYSGDNEIFLPVGGFNWLDTTVNGSPGTYSYALIIVTNNSSTALTFANVYLNAYEI